MAVENIENLWDSLKELVITQYSASSNLRTLCSKIVNSFQSIEDCCPRISDFCSIDLAEGFWLDLIGRLKNIERYAGEKDLSYKNRIKYEISLDYAGTPRFVIQRAVDISGDPKPTYLEEFHQNQSCVVFIYTPNGKQINSNFVKNICPAGVLGVPAAAMTDGDGNFIRDYNGNVMMAVANDAAIGKV